MRALYTAGTGMAAQELAVQVISNNVANLSTNGFKRQVVQFQDLLYDQQRRAGSLTSQQNTQVPNGVFVGTGVKVTGTPRIMSQGNLSPTEGTYDLAINGEGFFKIQMPDGTLSYSRDGSFSLDSQGRLVTTDGYVVDPGITVPQNSTNYSVSSTGLVTVVVPGQVAPQTVGQLTLTHFINKGGLESLGGNLYGITAASGPAVDALPGAEGQGTLQQGYIETSNVNSVTEITNLISAQRSYEFNSKVVSAADQMLSTTSSMFRS
jgi:flagellar basal-body rod protein FlgG